MFLTRKLLLLGAATLASFVLTPWTASAQITVQSEPYWAQDCAGLQLLPGHLVVGGCHMEFQSNGGVALHAYVPFKVTISNCQTDLEAWINQSAEGYVTSATLGPAPNSTVPCTRAACDEETHHMLPWPFHIREEGLGKEAEMLFCFRPSTAEEGSLGTQCEIHLNFDTIGGHSYELGRHVADPDEEFCENNPPGNPTSHPTPPVQISIEPHFIAFGQPVEFIH